MHEEVRRLIESLLHEVLFKAPTIEELPSLFGAPDLPGFRVNKRIAIYPVTTDEGPMYRVILAADLPSYVSDIALALCIDRRAHGTMLFSPEEVVRLVSQVEVAYLTEEVIGDRSIS